MTKISVLMNMRLECLECSEAEHFKTYIWTQIWQTAVCLGLVQSDVMFLCFFVVSLF